MNRGLYIIYFLLLASCSSLKVAENRTDVTLAITSNRYAELEPCGCALNPLGGVNREWNALEVKKPTWHFVSGTTFIPAYTQYDKKRISSYQKRAPFMVEALSMLGVTALMPSADDLRLGMGTLKILEREAKFHFVSSNLLYAGKPIFNSYLELEHGGRKFIVLGLSERPLNEYQDKLNIEYVEPEIAVKELRTIFKGKFLILLSSLSDENLERVLPLLDTTTVILGGESSGRDSFVQMLTPRIISINPKSRGRELGVMQLNLKNIGSGFTNPLVEQSLSQTRQFWMGRTKEWEREKSPIERKKIKAFLERTKSIESQDTTTSNPFESEFIALSKDFDSPKNRLTQIIEKVKETLRDLAISEANK